METIINLLNDKNYHLQKFLELNETEMIHFADGNFDNLEVFYQSRETILDLVRCIDRLIDAAAASQDSGTAISDDHKKQMSRAMALKNDLVTRILAQDLQILAMIEQTKSDIIRELRTLRGAKKAVGRYKSGDVVNKLDEKA